jgi:hypothetical protein
LAGSCDLQISTFFFFFFLNTFFIVSISLLSSFFEYLFIVSISLLSSFYSFYAFTLFLISVEFFFIIYLVIRFRASVMHSRGMRVSKVRIKFNCKEPKCCLVKRDNQLRCFTTFWKKESFPGNSRKPGHLSVNWPKLRSFFVCFCKHLLSSFFEYLFIVSISLLSSFYSFYAFTLFLITVEFFFIIYLVIRLRASVMHSRGMRVSKVRIKLNCKLQAHCCGMVMQIRRADKGF